MQRLNTACLDVTAKLGLFLLTRSKVNVNKMYKFGSIDFIIRLSPLCKWPQPDNQTINEHA